MDLPRRQLPLEAELPDGVRLAGASDRRGLVGLLCAAFHDDPLTKWILPDPIVRAATLPGFFEVFVDLSLDHGGVFLGGDFETALLFLSPVAPRDAQAHAEEVQARLARAVGGGGAASLLLTIIGMQAAHHPTHREHYYLSFGAVRPDRQRRGLLSHMVRPLLEIADREGHAMYTEASSAGGAAACLSFGFTPIGSVITLPNGPSLRPLWREPR